MRGYLVLAVPGPPSASVFSSLSVGTATHLLTPSHVPFIRSTQHAAEQKSVGRPKTMESFRFQPFIFGVVLTVLLASLSVLPTLPGLPFSLLLVAALLPEFVEEEMRRMGRFVHIGRVLFLALAAIVQ